MSTRNLFGGLLCLALLGCGSDSPVELTDVTGTYQVSRISGREGPTVIREVRGDPSCMRSGVNGDLREQLSGGSLRLTAGGDFELEFERTRTCRYSSDETVTLSTARSTGQYDVVAGHLVLHPYSTAWSEMTGVAWGSGGIRIETRIPGDLQSRTYDFVPFP